MKKIIFVAFLLILGCKTSKINKNSESTVLKTSFFSKKLNQSLSYQIYFPSDYKKLKEHYIIYLLHGHGESDTNWFHENEGNSKMLLDSLIQINKIKPLIAVSLNAENSWYVDSKKFMESCYIEEFIPLVEKKYTIKVNRKNRLISGNSAGGYGALGYGLKYPELFQAAILLSPAAYYPTPPIISSSRKIDVFKKDNIFNDSIWQSYSYLKQIDSLKENTDYPKFYISTGDDDAYDIFKVMVDLRDFFYEHDIKNEVLVINGGHHWDVWRKCFTNDLIRFFND